MPTPSQPLITLRNVGVFRANRWLVRGIDLVVRRGEILTLIGPNGSGKSTTAKTALGIIRPDEGQALRCRGLRVGYVPQRLVIDWSVPLNLGQFLNLTTRLSEECIEHALDSVGIAHLRSSPMQQLSGGEHQRALLARAIAQQPDLLVLDEPVQGVDYTGESKLYELISKLRDRLHCGVLMISHDLHIVMAATDSVVCLNGHVCCRGTPMAVVNSPEYRQLFGARATTLAVYEHHHDHTHLTDGRVLHADGSITAENDTNATGATALDGGSDGL